MKMLLKKIICLMLVLSFCFLLTSCLFMGNGDGSKSIVMVKNEKMSSYGTGFAVGVPGEPVEYIVTTYGVVASANGAIPQNALISVTDAKNDIVAEIVYCDIIKNVAVLKSAKKIDDLKPIYLTEKPVTKLDKKVSSFAYAGTGNLMSEYDKFNNRNVVSISGSLINTGGYDYIDTYLFTKEFNRAASGSPAIYEDGKVVGMFAYSSNILDTENPQFILASHEIAECLIEADIEFLTYEEAIYRNVCIITVCCGLLIILITIIITVIIGKKKKVKSDNSSDKMTKKYVLKVVSGTLGGFSTVLDKDVFIGRDPSKCAVVYPISQPGISGVHCAVMKREDGIYIKDNFSKCGTFLADGTKLSAQVPYKMEGQSFKFYLASQEHTVEITEEMEKSK